MLWDDPWSIWGILALTVSERPPRRCLNCIFTDEHGSYTEEYSSNTSSTQHPHTLPTTVPTYMAEPRINKAQHCRYTDQHGSFTDQHGS